MTLICPSGQAGWHRVCPLLQVEKNQDKQIMNFLDNTPSENRTKFTKL